VGRRGLFRYPRQAWRRLFRQRAAKLRQFRPSRAAVSRKDARGAWLFPLAARAKHSLREMNHSACQRGKMKTVRRRGGGCRLADW